MSFLNIFTRGPAAFMNENLDGFDEDKCVGLRADEREALEVFTRSRVIEEAGLGPLETEAAVPYDYEGMDPDSPGETCYYRASVRGVAIKHAVGDGFSYFVVR